MHDIHRRIKKAEKQLRIGPRPQLQEIIVQLTTLDETTAEGIGHNSARWRSIGMVAYALRQFLVLEIGSKLWYSTFQQL